MSHHRVRRTKTIKPLVCYISIVVPGGSDSNIAHQTELDDGPDSQLLSELQWAEKQCPPHFRPTVAEIQTELQDLENCLSVAASADTFVAQFKAWASFAIMLQPEDRFDVFNRLCARIRASDVDGAHVTLSMLEHLVETQWEARSIVDWLSTDGTLLPLVGTKDGRHLLRQLSLLVTRQEQGGRPYGQSLVTLYAKLSLPLLRREAFNKETAHLLNRAKWKSLLRSYRMSMEAIDFTILENLAVLILRGGAKPVRDPVRSEQLLDSLSRLARSGLQGAVVAHISEGLHNMTLGFKRESSQPMGLSELIRHVRFQHILNRARADGIEVPNLVRAEGQSAVIHHIAHKYSIKGFRSHSLRRGSLQALQKYLSTYKIPMQPMFTQALVRSLLSTPMSANLHVSSRKLAAVCKHVAKVEGVQEAKKIERTFFKWRGEMIQEAKEVTWHLEEGKPRGRGHLKKLKRLGII
ncbi:hypothetical protein M011DRAFT_6448 [Sporormia fimetaria CBS 119925]|uniref:Uncharacterized protein n=1 Tax=Sporormia fimetaria CBS 119925 TaxID=1340428 RepID=A0A6A6VQF2_9PLEO|nr:hypothetical protein M011DRAFT_6448 [Sporormia fimetaria CBS 119925]